MYFTCMTHVRQCEHNYDLISAMIRGYDILHFHLQWTLHLIMLWSGEGANVHFTCIFGEYAYSWFLSNISYQCDAIFFPGYRNQLQAIIAFLWHCHAQNIGLARNIFTGTPMWSIFCNYLQGHWNTYLFKYAHYHSVWCVLKTRQ